VAGPEVSCTGRLWDEAAHRPFSGGVTSRDRR
jgi:hypothetical protein